MVCGAQQHACSSPFGSVHRSPEREASRESNCPHGMLASLPRTLRVRTYGWLGCRGRVALGHRAGGTGAKGWSLCVVRSLRRRSDHAPRPFAAVARSTWCYRVWVPSGLRRQTARPCRTDVFSKHDLVRREPRDAAPPSPPMRSARRLVPKVHCTPAAAVPAAWGCGRGRAARSSDASRGRSRNIFPRLPRSDSPACHRPRRMSAAHDRVLVP